ncbi:LysM peptidoglycan-binding domain-containing protein [Bradyrhizobium sp. DASA03120]|uniref:LysM peptidoglycan-binding domain-containing protein n=1 Tax=Bradyrhizobium sp. SMVTL-02 TaxID=3395917 RepID=UPI003F72598B
MDVYKALTRNRRAAIIGALGALFLGGFEAEAQNNTSLSVDNPFGTQLTHDNMSQCDPKASKYYPSLSRITSFSYDFVPPDGGSGKRNGPDVQEARTIVFSVPEIGRSEIVRRIRANEQDSCETYVSLSNINFSIPDARSAVISFHGHGSSFNCGWFLGIHYKDWVASGDADLKIEYGLNDRLELVQKGAPQVTNVSVSTNWTYEHLGVLLGLFFPGPTGVAIASLIERSITNKLADIGDFGASRETFGSFVTGLKGLSDYTAAIDLSQAPSAILITDPQASGLTPNSVDEPIFTLVQRVTYGPILGKASFKNRLGEIALLKDLSIKSPRLYTVQRGDSLWAISKRTYNNPFMYLMIEDTNHLRHKSLRVGAQIVLPLLYELCDKMENLNALVRPLDSISKLRERIGTDYHPVASQFRSRNLNLIYPWEASTTAR